MSHIDQSNRSIPGPVGKSKGRTAPSAMHAMVKRFRHGAHDRLRLHLADFAGAYNYARRQKTLRASHAVKPSARRGKNNRKGSAPIRYRTARVCHRLIQWRAAASERTPRKLAAVFS